MQSGQKLSVYLLASTHVHLLRAHQLCFSWPLETCHLALTLPWTGAMDATFAEAAQECSVPADFASTVLAGFSVATFARVASAREACESVFSELLIEGHLDSSPASERIQALASLRLLLNRRRSEEQLASLEGPPPAEVVTSAPAGSTPPAAGLGWHEAWPAKLTAGRCCG